MDKHIEVMFENYEFSHGPVTAQMFGNAGVEHMKKYGEIIWFVPLFFGLIVISAGTKPEHFAKIAYKNHKHSVNNP